MIEKEYTCIICPLSCDLILSNNNKNLSVTGNTCKRGEIYAISEYTNPTRMVTTTVKTNSKELKVLPVISRDPIPKNMIRKCLDLLHRTHVKDSINAGDVVISNILETGVDILAARTIK